MDILDIALSDFYYKGEAPEVLIHNKYGDPDPMPVETYFRDIGGMPDVEVFAMSICKGRILDVGAGVGCHTMYLQDAGKEVEALELSTLRCRIMGDRGVNRIIEKDFFKYRSPEKYDTLLLLMNTIGLSATVERLKVFLKHAEALLTTDGAIIFDSSDVAYVWDDNRLKQEPYYGEIDYQYQYGDLLGEWFKWLYVDYDTMSGVCKDQGWDLQVLFEDDTGHYLGRLTKMDERVR